MPAGNGENTGDLEKIQEEWYKKARVEKTWDNFKLHFERVYRILKRQEKRL